MGAIATLIAGTPEGGTANATGLTENAYLPIGKEITLLNGTVTAPTTSEFGNPALSADASNITVDGTIVDGGGHAVRINGARANVTFRDVVVDRNLHNGPAFFWFGAITNVLFENCDFINGSLAASKGTGGGRCAEDDAATQSATGQPCPVFGDGITWRDCYFYQMDPGWLGVEVKCARNVLMENCMFRGGGSLCSSWPDCQDVTFDGIDAVINDWSDGRPWGFLEQAGPKAATFTMRNSVVSGKNLGGTVYWLNSLNYAIIDKPVLLIECNSFTNGLSYMVDAGAQTGGLQHATVKNNTLATGVQVTNSNGTTGNVFSNNDADGAEHGDCVGVPTESGDGAISISVMISASGLADDPADKHTSPATAHYLKAAT